MDSHDLRILQPYEAIQRRAAKDHTTLVWTFRDFDLTTAASYATQKSAAIVFINADSGEDYITVDGNQGDRYVLQVLINDACLRRVSKQQFDGMARGRPISLDGRSAKQQYYRCRSQCRTSDPRALDRTPERHCCTYGLRGYL